MFALHVFIWNEEFICISGVSLFPEQMFCFQCEQTRLRKGCTTVGVCGKTSQVAELQDLLVHIVKGIGVYSHHAKLMGYKVPFEIYDFTFSALFRWLLIACSISLRLLLALPFCIDLAEMGYVSCISIRKWVVRLLYNQTLLLLQSLVLADFDYV